MPGLNDLRHMLQSITADPRKFPGPAIVVDYDKDSGGNMMLVCETQPQEETVHARPQHPGTSDQGGVFSPYPIGSSVLLVYLDGDINRAVAVGGIVNSTQRAPDDLYGKHLKVKDKTKIEIDSDSEVDIFVSGTKIEVRNGTVKIGNGGATQGLVTSDILDGIQNIITYLGAVNAAHNLQVCTPVIPDEFNGGAGVAELALAITAGGHKTSVLEGE